MALYSRNLVDDARRTKRFHYKADDGACAGCKLANIWVKHGECDPWLWSEGVLKKVSSPVK